MHRAQRIERSARGMLLLALAFAGCGGDYWLGGVRGAAGRGTAGSAGSSGSSGSSAKTELHELSADIVLSGDQNYEVGTPSGSGCRIVGHGHVIRSQGAWRGQLSIRGCDIVGLGSSSTEAISLQMSGSASTTIEGSSFDASGAVHLTTYDESSITFRNNVILETSLTPLDASFDKTTPAFLVEGDSTQPKFFQGNRIYRSNCWFNSSNWLIGGDSDRESNILIGLRVGFALEASQLVVRGNYVHNIMFPSAGDESALTVIYGTTDALAEHNVLRHGTWVVRGFGGELRYNAIIDADNSNWMVQPFEDTKVHHNLFFMCAPASGTEGVQAGIALVNARTTGIEIFNNTLDGGGPSMRITGAAVSVADGCFLDSLRSNAIFGFPLIRNDHGEAAIRPGIQEGIDPPAARLGYADYNLFYNPDAGTRRNYALAAAKLVLRKDAGFALHDANAGGPIDEQVEPRLTGSSSDCFPFSDDEIKAGRVTVSQMLADWRAAYTPRANSPLVGAGDPADGQDNPIGAIGDGTQAADRFGTFGR
jgi:hypothetical protein